MKALEEEKKLRKKKEAQMSLINDEQIMDEPLDGLTDRRFT